jgi:Diaminopimelate epimerase
MGRPGRLLRGKAGPGGLAARFEIYNRDGGRAELSGNGMAALAAVLLRRCPAGSPLVLLTAIGSRRVRLLERRGPRFRFDVEIGRPDFAHRAFFPFLSKGQDSYRAAGTDFCPVSVGNPHAVVLRRTMPGVARLEALGKKLEAHPMFPKRVNVEFVQARGPSSCRVFFYERGVGPTRASSTGSAAVFAVLRRLGMAGDQLQIEPLAPSPGNGGGDDPIVLRWREGIQVEIVTGLICKGRYFG